MLYALLEMQIKIKTWSIFSDDAIDEILEDTITALKVNQ